MTLCPAPNLPTLARPRYLLSVNITSGDIEYVSRELHRTDGPIASLADIYFIENRLSFPGYAVKVLAWELLPDDDAQWAVGLNGSLVRYERLAAFDEANALAARMDALAELIQSVLPKKGGTL